MDEDFNWTTSPNGNLICEWNFTNATVFEQFSGWKFVVNVNGAPKENAVFSEKFRSQHLALVRAEEFMEELFEEALSRGE